MYVTATQAQDEVPVTVLHIKGELDASNYQIIIDKAREAYAGGTRNVLLDLSEVPYMGSSGLVAFHSVALLMRGETPPDPEGGWGALRSIDREREAGPQQHVKLLNPQPKVDRVLRMAGFDQFFEIFTDEKAAIASFPAGPVEASA
jgi:anti-anti-sigma regulatory factor